MLIWSPGRPDEVDQEGVPNMVGVKRWWTAFRNIAILFSFLVNIVLIIVLLVVMSVIFQIKSGIADPLVGGLYSSFVGLNDARIISQVYVNDMIQVNDMIKVQDTIVVSDSVPVQLQIPLQQNTNVVLTSPVSLNANAEFTLPGGGGNIRGSVAITLPSGLVLPVALDLTVPVDSSLPINLNVPVDMDVPINLDVPVNLTVPVDIDLTKTQLNDVALSLRSVIEPYARLLSNLPGDWPSAWDMFVQALNGRPPNLMADSAFIQNPWPGYETGLGATPTPVPTADRLVLPEQPTPLPATPMPSVTPTLTIPTLAPTVTPSNP